MQESPCQKCILIIDLVLLGNSSKQTLMSISRTENLEQKFQKLVRQTVKNKEDKRRMLLALEKARMVHEGQQRQSGEDYLLHPLQVAINLQKAFSDPNLTIAGLLHDTVEDGKDIGLQRVCRRFGKDVCFLVDSVTKTILHYYRNQKKTFEDKIEKTLWGGMKDVRVLLLKIYDRENNLSDLENLSPHKQIRMSFETQAIYFPLLEILGIEKSYSISKVEKYFKKFLKDNHIQNEKKLKKLLLLKGFQKIGRKEYDIIYKNSDKIMWTVNDRKFYSTLCQSEEFNKSTGNIRFWSDGKKFKAFFYLQKGMVIKNQTSRLEISRFKYDTK